MEIKEFGENGAGYRLRKFIVRFDGTDAVVKTPKYIYVFEFKLNGTAEQALQQIDDRMYAEEYEDDYDQILCYGISFFKKRCMVKKK